MKHIIRLLSITGCTAALLLGSASALAKDEAKCPQSSVRVSEDLKESELPAKAGIPLQKAVETALAATPGSVIKAALEVEDGNLVYSVEIVGADKTVTEVVIDAGNGKVLASVKDADEEHSDGEQHGKSEKKEHKKDKKDKEDEDEDNK